MENIEPSHSQYDGIEQPIQRQAGGKRMSFWASSQDVVANISPAHSQTQSQRKAKKLIDVFHALWCCVAV